MLRLVFGFLLTCSMAVSVCAQTVVPGSQLPLASPSPGDVLFGIHGGTSGVGGTTSKFAYPLMGPVLGINSGPGITVSVSSGIVTISLNPISGFCPGNNTVAGTACAYGGSGAPTFSAPNGSTYMRYDGGAGTRFYVNTSGASTSGTTWTAEF